MSGGGGGGGCLIDLRGLMADVSGADNGTRWCFRHSRKYDPLVVDLTHTFGWLGSVVVGRRT